MAGGQAGGSAGAEGAIGAKRYVFAISYGRTGSTLLMALLSNHPRVLVRGENRSLLRYLQGAYDSLASSHDSAARATSNPFYGAHLFEDAFLVPWLRATVESFLAGDRAPESFDVLGFKEVFYNDEDTVRVDLDFIRRLFPGCLLLFNTRDPAEVARSDFNARWSEERFSRLNRLYAELAVEYGGLVVDYSDIVEFGVQTQAVFARLGIKPEPETIVRTLHQQQGYVPSHPGARVSRVPYFVRVLPHDAVGFLDIGRVSVRDGVVSVQGGIVAEKGISQYDWSVETEQGSVAGYEGGLEAARYCPGRLPDPSLGHCGFDLKLVAARNGVAVALFGRPLLKISRISAMPKGGA